MINLIGFILPPVIDLINRKVADSDVRFWISVLVCTIFGAVMNLVTHNGLMGYDGMTMLEIFNSFAESALAMFGTAQLSYKAIWEGSKVRDELGLNARTAIERDA